MHGHSVSTVDAYTAHREWARRPPDERYASVEQLYDAARARRSGTEERLTETVNLHVQAVAADALAIGDRQGQTLGADTLELRAARRHRRRAADVSPNACPHRSPRRRSTTGCNGPPASSSSSSRTRTHRGPSTRSPHRGTRGSTTTSWPVACSTSWPCTRPGIFRSDTRTASWVPNACRPAPIWETETCSCSSWTAIAISTTPPTRRTPDCSAGSCSGTATSAPPP